MPRSIRQSTRSVRASLLRLLFCFCLLAAAGYAVAQENPLPNPGFEDGPDGWALKDAISQVTPEAARSGKLGLRIGAMENPPPKGSSVSSAAFEVKPGQEITIEFWGRSQHGGGGVYMLFKDERNRWLKSPGHKAGGGLAMAGVKKTGDEWKQYSVTGSAPDKAATVALWIHSYGSTKGLIDIDDITITGVAADAKIIPVGAYKRPEREKPVDPAAVPRRKTPAVIILKFDDLKQHHGKVHGRWQAVADYLDSRQIKGSIGVICQTLQDATPEYASWIKQRRDSGQWEFWFHGWDHKPHVENGTKYNEFNQRSYDEQKKRFDDSQRLAMEKLGFAFETFGPTGGTSNGMFDENTIAAVADDPYIKAWLYPQPIDDRGRALEAQGKVVILDRVWAVNLEGSVGAPDLNRFLKGYAKNLDRPYFVLQGHPAAWNDLRFEQFTKIIDFLVERDAVFMTPSEYAGIKANSDGQ